MRQSIEPNGDQTLSQSIILNDLGAGCSPIFFYSIFHNAFMLIVLYFLLGNSENRRLNEYCLHGISKCDDSTLNKTIAFHSHFLEAQKPWNFKAKLCDWKSNCIVEKNLFFVCTYRVRIVRFSLNTYVKCSIWNQYINDEWMNLMETVILLGFPLLFMYFDYYLTQTNCSSASTVEQQQENENQCRAAAFLHASSRNVWWKFMLVYQLPSSSSLNNKYSRWFEFEKQKIDASHQKLLMWFFVKLCQRW